MIYTFTDILAAVVVGLVIGYVLGTVSWFAAGWWLTRRNAR